MNLKQSLNSALERTIGYRIVKKKAPEPKPLERFFAMLKKQNFQPGRIYDVGANHGNWTRCATSYFPHASYTLIEPQAHLKAEVEDLIQRGINIEWITAGAGSECGVQSFKIFSRDDSSTFMSWPDTAEDVRRVEMEVVTLNKIASMHSTKPDLVKIDAEGWDLKVLTGASDLIGTTDIFLIEAGVWAGGIENTIFAVMQKFDQWGYRLIDITDLNRSSKDDVLWLTELAFIRRESPLMDKVVGYW